MSGKKSTEQLESVGISNNQPSGQSPGRATVSFFHRSMATVSVQTTPVIKTRQDIEELVRQAHQLMRDILTNLEQGILLGDDEKALKAVDGHLNSAHTFLTTVNKDDYTELHQQLVGLKTERDELQQRISPTPGVK